MKSYRIFILGILLFLVGCANNPQTINFKLITDFSANETLSYGEKISVNILDSREKTAVMGKKLLGKKESDFIMSEDFIEDAKKELIRLFASQGFVVDNNDAGITKSITLEIKALDYTVKNGLISKMNFDMQVVLVCINDIQKYTKKYTITNSYKTFLAPNARKNQELVNKNFDELFQKIKDDRLLTAFIK